MPSANRRRPSMSPLRLIGTVHRWAGASIGIVLVILGLTGTILIHRNSWISLPHAHDAQSRSTLGPAVARIMRDPLNRPAAIQFATRDMALDQLTYADGAGAYADQEGIVVAHWQRQWARPELWLFDLHRHLLAGRSGEIVAGIAAIAGLLLLTTGSILWWQTRSTYEFRLLPKRLSRPAIIRYHRDLGVVAAPVLALSLLTAAILVFAPAMVAQGGFGATSAIGKALATPPLSGAAKGAIPIGFDWRAIVSQAQARFPDGDIRGLAVSGGDTGPIMIRVRQPGDWQPNGSTILWFAPDGRLVAVRDAARFGIGVRTYEMIVPLHSAAVGGLAYRLLLSVVGVMLVLIGALAVWSFWFRRPVPIRNRAKRSHP